MWSSELSKRLLFSFCARLPLKGIYMYNSYAEIEEKWQNIWDEKQVFRAVNDYTKPKYYALIEFPYPSGQGLHVGHPRPYTALDIVARKRRLEGYNVLYPMGWDAFGLPTENYAMKNHIHPELVTAQNVARFKEQIKSLGLSFDWSREINTTDPSYYKWTQWIFLQLFKHGLAYKSEMAVNWCTSCKVVLANEEVVNGGCERCGSEVVRKVKSQWMLKITEYAQKLLDDLDSVDYIERVKTSQKNWIGRSTGAEVKFTTTANDQLVIYTTRPDTLFGATYMVISPEHPMINEKSDLISNMVAIDEYRQRASHKSDFERTEVVKEKTGIRLDGINAINPVNNEEIPIYVSDYVLMSYGTGAIMAVPGHDTRDYEFAKAFDLPIIEVVAGGNIEEEAYTDCATGVMVNSGFLTGLSVEDAKVRMVEWLKETGLGTPKTNFKLRDWVFSRQRYWGEPIPIVYCEKCGYVPLSEDQLPLVLPDLKDFEPTDDGQSPLSKLPDFVNTVCPCCKGPAKRETDTMPQWAGSSWYFLRYCDPANTSVLAAKEALAYWLPIDWYNGGMEHTTLHLLYSRFWHKFLFDIGVVTCKEPYMKRTSHGMILGEDGQKMSKSRGNVVNPDDVVRDYGADTLRLFEMFIGDFEKSAPWKKDGVNGCRRFLDRVWSLQESVIAGNSYSDALEVTLNKTIKKVTEDIEALKFNTAIAAMMTLMKAIQSAKSINKAEYKTLLILLNPFAPHITEELYERAGFDGMLSQQQWPLFDEARCKDDEVELAVQVNGKIKSKLVLLSDVEDSIALAAAKADEKIAELIAGKTIIKEIVVKNKLVNIVVK